MEFVNSSLINIILRLKRVVGLVALRILPLFKPLHLLGLVGLALRGVVLGVDGLVGRRGLREEAVVLFGVGRVNFGVRLAHHFVPVCGSGIL